MRLSTTMQKCVSFARFVRDNKIAPLDAAELCHLAQKAFKAGEREANTGKSADPQREAFERMAKNLGFSTKWPGLLPMLTKRGNDIHLPMC